MLNNDDMNVADCLLINANLMSLSNPRMSQFIELICTNAFSVVEDLC